MSTLRYRTLWPSVYQQATEKDPDRALRNKSVSSKAAVSGAGRFRGPMAAMEGPNRTKAETCCGMMCHNVLKINIALMCLHILILYVYNIVICSLLTHIYIHTLYIDIYIYHHVYIYIYIIMFIYIYIDIWFMIYAWWVKVFTSFAHQCLWRVSPSRLGSYDLGFQQLPSLEGFAKFPMCSLSEMSKVLLRRVLHKGEQNSMGLGRVFPCRPSHLSHPDHV